MIIFVFSLIESHKRATDDADTDAPHKDKKTKSTPEKGKEKGKEKAISGTAKGEKDSKSPKKEKAEKGKKAKETKETKEAKKDEKVVEDETEDDKHESHIADKDEIISDFHELVNMTGNEIHKWLQTKESKEVGWKGEDGHDQSKESVGHASGKRIIELLKKNDSDFSDDDVLHMRKVRSYIKRHSAQKPDHDVEHTRWRYSLMNWGHDPSKE